MRSIRIENNQILYFGNPAGYIAGTTAVVDPIFKNEELNTYLQRQGGIDTISWKSGVYDRLMNGGSETSGAEPLKKVRIWQLKPESNIYMKFCTYDILVKRFGEPEPHNYRNVYDGEIETNDLDQIYEKFNLGIPLPEYEGHSLSVSDVIELYDEEGSKFYYVDTIGFQSITFEEEGAEQVSIMEL